MFLSCFYVLKISEIILLNNQSREKCSADAARTHTSCSLGEHPNHLDHQHHWLFLVLTLIQELIGQISKTLTFCNCLLQLTYLAHLCICSAHLLDVTYHQLNISQLLLCIENNFTYIMRSKQKSNLRK